MRRRKISVMRCDADVVIYHATQASLAAQDGNQRKASYHLWLASRRAELAMLSARSQYGIPWRHLIGTGEIDRS